MESTNSPHGSNWIIATGQAWKLYGAIAGFTASLGLLTAGCFSLASSGRFFMALAACGLFLGCATFVWFAAVLCCPSCRAKLVWTMASSRPHSSWIIDLAALDRCPACNRELDRISRSQP